MSKQTKSNQKQTQAIWTVAGLVLLGALIVGTFPNNKANAELKVNTTAPATAPRMDVVFTIDATGSMGDEIDVVKKEIWSIANNLMVGTPRPDVRLGLVFYQDRGDTFLVKKTALTRDIDKVHADLMAIQAGGGGDWREHVGRGLHEALDLSWDQEQGVSRTIYLVGDAPGHDDYQDGYSLASAIDKAKSKGVVINAIGCSGLDSGRGEFERVASQTNGIYKDLTYQAIVKGDDGRDRSVIYFDGELYEADTVMKKSEWGRGGDVLLKEGKLKRAKKKTRTRAASAPKVNNLDDVVTDGMKEDARSLGVSY